MSLGVFLPLQFSGSVLSTLGVQFTSVQCLSCVQQFAPSWTAARQASQSITKFWSLFKLMSVESVMPSNHLILCRPFPLPPSIFSRIRVFSNESALRIRGPNYWIFSCNIRTSNAYSGLISFRIDWFDLAFTWPLKNVLIGSWPSFIRFYWLQLGSMLF